MCRSGESLGDGSRGPRFDGCRSRSIRPRSRRGAGHRPPFVGVASTSARTAGMSARDSSAVQRDGSWILPTLGVSNVAGRSFQPGDDRRSVIVNARLARTCGETSGRRSVRHVTNPGQTDHPSASGASRWSSRTEIRISQRNRRRRRANAPVADVGIPDGPTFYLPIAGRRLSGASFVVRSSARQPLQRLVEETTRGPSAVAAGVNRGARGLPNRSDADRGRSHRPSRRADRAGGRGRHLRDRRAFRRRREPTRSGCMWRSAHRARVSCAWCLARACAR